MRFILGVILFLGLSNSGIAQSEGQGSRKEIISDSVQVEKDVSKADSLKKAGKINESIQLLQQSEQIAETSNNPYLIQLIGLELADSYLYNNQPGKAVGVLKSILQQFPKGVKKTNLLSMLGSAYRFMGRYDEALKKQKEALALVDSVESPEKFARIQFNLASLYEASGDIAGTLKYYLSGIEIIEGTSDSTLLATALNNLGVTYNNALKYKEANHYLVRSIEISKEIGNQVALLRATNNLAITERGLGNLEEAAALYAQALVLHKTVRKDTPPFRILYNLGELSTDRGELDKAEDYYRRSLNYCEEAGIAQGLIYNYGGLANVEELRQHLAQAHDYYAKALEVAEQINAISLQKDVLHSFYLLEKKRKKFQQALTYFEQYTTLKDSLDAKAQEQELTRIETELGLRQQRELNELLQEKQQQQETQLATQNWLIILSIAIIIIILVSLLLLYQSNTEKQHINEELEVQRSQLEDLNKVKDKMMAIIAHDLRSPLASMHGMLYLLREDDLSKGQIQEMTAELEVSLDQNINMMDNLLAWAREQMSGLEVNLILVEAHEVVAEVLDGCEFRASHKGIILNNEVSKEITVKADINLLRLILRNLIANSLKFSNEGDQIIVKASKGSGRVIFEVEDTGIGMSDKVRSTIFSNDGKSRLGTLNEKGSGLGLQLCKEFVEKQHGEISIDSTEGEGTSFKFSLPEA